MIDLSHFAKTLNTKSVAVFGLGLSGLASIDALMNAGAKVIAWDDKGANIPGAECEPLTPEILSKCARLVLSPGVPLTHPEPHPVVKAAQEAGIEIIGDLEILHRAGHGRKTIGITGTNGKSTTTALIGHILKTLNIPNMIGGNIGAPVLSQNLPPENGVIVLEISSYQIDLCPTFRPDIAVLLNITPDHIDRHGNFENYKAIKHRLLQGAGQAINAEELPPPPQDFPNLPGAHNQQNIAAALAVCDALGLDQAAAIAAIKTFPGLAHRQYLVRKIGDIKYVNDSKATNAEAAGKALSSYENIYWIAGGQAKEGGLKGLESLMPRIKHAFLIGESAEEFAEYLNKQNVSYSILETLEAATNTAHNMAQAQGTGTILLSPACASWDQFKSFEHRGDVFTQIVEGLDE